MRPNWLGLSPPRSRSCAPRLRRRCRCRSPASRNRPFGSRARVAEYGARSRERKSENKHLIIDFYTNGAAVQTLDAIPMEIRRSPPTCARTSSSQGEPESSSRSDPGRDDDRVQLARDFGVSSFPITWFIRPDGSRIDR